jgi:hypothetical protein
LGFDGQAGIDLWDCYKVPPDIHHCTVYRYMPTLHPQIVSFYDGHKADPVESRAAVEDDVDYYIHTLLNNLQNIITLTEYKVIITVFNLSNFILRVLSRIQCLFRVPIVRCSLHIHLTLVCLSQSVVTIKSPVSVHQYYHEAGQGMSGLSRFNKS